MSTSTWLPFEQSDEIQLDNSQQEIPTPDQNEKQVVLQEQTPNKTQNFETSKTKTSHPDLWDHGFYGLLFLIGKQLLNLQSVY